MSSLKGTCDIGTRFHVTTQNGMRDLGLGTYLQQDEILLDRGTKVQARFFAIEPVRPSSVPPFTVELQNDMRLFRALLDSRLAITDFKLPTGKPICIETIALKKWEYGPTVAGRCTVDNSPFWLLMSTMVLPFEAHLTLVA